MRTQILGNGGDKSIRTPFPYFCNQVRFKYLALNLALNLALTQKKRLKTNRFYSRIINIKLRPERGLTRMAARNRLIHTYIHTYIQPNSALFSCQVENRRNFKGVFCPIYHGRDAPFLLYELVSKSKTKN